MIHPVGHDIKVLFPPATSPVGYQRDGVCSIAQEMGWWQEGTEPSWLLSHMAPAQGLQRKHWLLSTLRSKVQEVLPAWHQLLFFGALHKLL